MFTSTNQTKVLARFGFESWWFAIATWLFVLEYSLYLVRPSLPDRIIKITALACLLLSLISRYEGVRNDDKKLLLLFLGLLTSALLPSIWMGDSTGIIQWLKFAFMFSVFPALLVGFRASSRTPNLIVTLYLAIAILFSLQAIVAFIAVFAGYFQSPDLVDIGRRPGQTANSLGLLGYANAVQNPIDCIRVLRAQGWFVEPSIFSAFLLFPGFIAFGHYVRRKTVVALLVTLLIAAGLALTFSIAGLIGVAVGLTFFFLSAPLHEYLGKLKPFRYAYPIFICLGLLLPARGIVGLANVADKINVSSLASLEQKRSSASTQSDIGRAQSCAESSGIGEVKKMFSSGSEREEAFAKLAITSSKMIAKSPDSQSGNIFREHYKFNGYKSVFLSHPTGIGLGKTAEISELTSANAVFFWLVAGGLPAILIAAMLFWYLFWTYCHPLLQAPDPVYRCVAASFLGHAVHNVSYGNWLAPFFLLHLAIVVATAHRLKEAAGSGDSPTCLR